MTTPTLPVADQHAPSQAQAMVLAAGRGERMRPLTDACPKPLLPVRGKPLLQWHLEALGAAGFDAVLVNTAWLGEQIEARFGARLALGSDATAAGRAAPATALQVHLRYSHEGRDFGGALETAGGIARALPLLDDVFWVAAGDVYMPGFEFSRAAWERFAASDALAHLWLVPNPQHNPKGDFALDAQGRVRNQPAPGQLRHTYSTVGLYRKALFDTLPTGNPHGLKAPLAPLLRQAADNGRITGELYPGRWTDVGTPERLAQLNTSTANP